MPYEEEAVQEAVLAAGDDLLFYSDGLVETHDPKGELLGFSRLQGLIKAHGSGDYTV